MKNKKLILTAMLMALTSLSSFATGKGSDGENGSASLSTDLSDTEKVTFYSSSGEELKVLPPVKNSYTGSTEVGMHTFCHDSGFLSNQKILGEISLIHFRGGYLKAISTNDTIYVGTSQDRKRTRSNRSKKCLHATMKASKKELEQEINNNYLKFTDRITSHSDQIVQLLGGQDDYEQYLTRKKFEIEIGRFIRQLVKDIFDNTDYTYVILNRENGFTDGIADQYRYLEKFTKEFKLQTQSFLAFTSSIDELTKRSFLSPFKLFISANSKLQPYVERTSQYLPGSQGWNNTIAEMRTFWSQSEIRSFYEHLRPTFINLRVRFNNANNNGENHGFSDYEIELYNNFLVLEQTVETYELN